MCEIYLLVYHDYVCIPETVDFSREGVNVIV